MPELPEAENICRALDRALSGRLITAVEVFSPAMRTPIAPLTGAGLEGKSILKVIRRGRYVVMVLDDGRGILLHFGMSGVVRVEGAEVPRRKHEHIFIHLDDGRIFRFECTRRFSLCEVHTLNASGVPPVLDKLGVEPLSDDFTGSHFYRSCRGRKSPVKNLLMDNTIVVGIGNIYAAETLHAAGIDPRRNGGDLTEKECEVIVKSAREILCRAIAAGGTTVSDFLNVDGSEGLFVRELLVYGRAGKKCARCGGYIAVCRQGGRSSFYCPGCQK